MLQRFGFLALAIGLFTHATAAQAQVTRVSLANDGSEPNGKSSGGLISGNGRFVAFASDATNLVAGDTNGMTDVFVRDLVDHTTTRVSLASDGTERPTPSSVYGISDDGRFVTFASYGTFVAGVTTRCTDDHGSPRYCNDIYVRDRTTGQTERVNVASDGTEGNNDSRLASMSGDGRYVLFGSLASNLAAGDTNGVEDIYLRDRSAHTTTRISVSPAGQQSTFPSVSPAISRDGRVVAFVGHLGSLGDAPGEDHCGAFDCNRAFVRTLAASGMQRLKRTQTFAAQPGTIEAFDVLLNADGRYAAVTELVRWEFATYTQAHLHDVAHDAILPVEAGIRAYAISDDGRYMAGELFKPNFLIGDRFTGLVEQAPNPPASLLETLVPSSFDATARYVVYSSIVTTQNQSNVFLFDRDVDGDGLFSYWETYYGLDPLSAADATGDADGDGMTNLDEFQQNGVPTGVRKQYFAEGAANAFIATRVAIVNPGDVTASVGLQLLGSTGQRTSRTVLVPAKSRRTFSLTDNLPDTVFAMVVESDKPVAADRLMTWDATGYGSHLESAIAAPSLSWYFAEGATGGPYSLYYLLQNPNPTAAQVTVTYLRPAPLAPITKSYTVTAHSRTTIDVRGEDAGLAAAEVSARIVSDQPIVAERALYYSTLAQFEAAGHDGAGIAAPATRWFLAEGATGFFDEYVLIANPDETTDAHVTVTYLLENGTSFTDAETPIVVKKQSRLTLDLKARDTRLQSAVVSVIVESTNSVPIVTERVMWWPHGNWYEASLSAGTTTTGTRWVVAEGEQGGPQNAATYLLVANTDTTNGSAKVTLLYDGVPPESKTFAVDAQRRTSVDIGGEFPASAGRTFGILVESTGPQIVVERSLYASPNGVTFAAGGTSVAMKLPAVP